MFDKETIKAINLERMACEHRHQQDFGFFYDREKDLQFIMDNYDNSNMTKDHYVLAIFAVQYLHREIGIRKGNEALELIENDDAEGLAQFYAEHADEIDEDDIGKFEGF